MSQGKKRAKQDDQGSSRELMDKVAEMQRTRIRAAPAPAPGRPPVDAMGQPIWSAAEQETLEENLKRFSRLNCGNMILYIKISGHLPNKTVRDVAARLRVMQDARLNSNRHQRIPSTLSGVKRQRPDPELEQAMAQLMTGQSQQAQGLAGGTIQSLAAAEVLTSPTGNGPHPQDRELQGHIHLLLQKNVRALHGIRDNIVHSRLLENYSLMEQFQKSYNQVNELLRNIPFGMPPAPPLPAPQLPLPRSPGSPPQPFPGVAFPFAAQQPPSQHPGFYSLGALKQQDIPPHGPGLDVGGMHIFGKPTPSFPEDDDRYPSLAKLESLVGHHPDVGLLKPVQMQAVTGLSSPFHQTALGLDHRQMADN